MEIAKMLAKSFGAPAEAERAADAIRGVGHCTRECVLTTLVDLRENHGTEAEPRWVRTITVRCETHGAGLAQWGIGKERPAGRVGNLLEPA
jgi:hypothetical protein